MLKSMTGFGRAEKMFGEYNIKVNIKSVNHRYADITVKLPKYYGFAEETLRQAMLRCISRGKIEVFVSVDRTEGTVEKVVLDRSVAADYISALRELEDLGLKLSDDVAVSALARFKEIFKIEGSEEDEEKLSAMISEVFDEAAADFVSMRSAEGARMEADILSHLEILENNLREVEKRYPEIVTDYRNRLEARIREVLGDKEVDETRLITEAAIFAEKSDIAEETVRLSCHIQEFRNAIKTDKPIGKKLDFIIQEMNRETNTMGSKASDVTVTKHIVEMKSEIEKVREQVQNIE